MREFVNTALAELAERQHGVVSTAQPAAFGRCPRPAPQAIIDADRPAAVTSSVLERAFLEVVRAAGLPEPAANAHRGGGQLDFRRPKRRLIVETAPTSCRCRDGS